jgi:Flp pilus assembly protein TadD/4-amino-4-deoxy-L-arabinose transferase-like glycosyltransferase
VSRKARRWPERTQERPQAPVPPAPHRAWLGPLLGLLAAVFVLKLVVVWQLHDHPLVQPDVGLDTTAYVDLAKKVLAGDVGLGPGLYYVSPLYIYFLAIAYGITKSFTAVRVLQVVLGTASIGFIFLSAREWFGDRAAWIAAGCAALTGLFTFYEALILQAALDPFLTSAALYLVTLGLKRDVRWLVAAGVVFGIATLNRPNMPLGVAGIAGMLVVTRRQIVPAALLVAGLIAGMAPAAIRNVIVSHQFSFVSSHGGLNFYIGNSETATGFFHPLPGITPNIAGQERDAKLVAERALGRSLTESEASDYFFGLAFDWMRAHPLDAIVLFFRKLGYVFNAQHIALPYSYPFYAYDAGTMLRFYFVGPWLLVPLGLVGLVVAAPVEARKDYLVWLAFVPSFAVSVAAFFIAERYRLPLLIQLSIGAGAAVDFAWRTVASGRAKTLGIPALAFGVIFGLANWTHGLHDGRWDEGLRMAERLVLIGRNDEAEQWVAKLEPEAPRHGIVDYTVGVAYLSKNNTTAALAHLTKAAQYDPGQANIEYAIGQTLLRANNAAAALPHLRRGFEGGTTLDLPGYDLAVALESTGDRAGALDVIPRIKLSGDAPPDAWMKIGRLAGEMHAPDVAEPFFARAATLRPDFEPARQQHGLNLAVLNRFDDAARELGDAVRLDPHDADALAYLAYCEAKLGRADAAREHAKAALTLKPDHPLASQVLAALGK